VGEFPLDSLSRFHPIIRGEPLARLINTDKTSLQEPPQDWPGTFALVHRMWGEVSAGGPYDKSQWCRLLEALEQHAWRAGYRCPRLAAASTVDRSRPGAA
jgi:hypothetical protein